MGGYVENKTAIHDNKHRRKLEILHLYFFSLSFNTPNHLHSGTHTYARAFMYAHTRKHLNIHFILLLYHSQ